MKRPGGNYRTLLFIALTVAASIVLVRGMDYLQESPLSLTRVWQTPSVVAASPDGSMAVVEKSKMLVTLTDPQGRIRARIRGGSYDEDSFYYAEHIATDGESVVIAEVRHAENSTFVEGERLLRYDMNGNRLEVLYSVTYAGADRPRQLGRINSVQIEGNRVLYTWADRRNAGVSVCENGKTRTIKTQVLEDDDFLHVAYEPVTGMLCFTTKKGGLGVAGGVEPIRWLPYGNGQRVPWSAAITPQGTVLVSELASGSVQAVTDNAEETLWESGPVYELTASDSLSAFTNGATVFVYHEGSDTLTPYGGASLSPGFGFWLLLTWGCAAYLSVTMLWLAIRLIHLMRRQARSAARRRMRLISASVLVSVIVVMAFLLSFTQRQIQTQTLNGLSQLAETISSTSGEVFGDRLSKISNLSDYQDDDYNAVKKYLDAFCDASYRNGSNLYYVLYRFDATQLWGVMDYENTTGARYPYCLLEGSLYGEVIATGKSRRAESEADIYGMWSYTVAPVYASTGETVGLVEIGTNQYGDVVAQQKLIQSVLIGVLMALLMAMLAYNEFTAFNDHLAQRRAFRDSGEGRIALGFIRALIFLVFMADNMDAAYIPQLSAALGAVTAGFLGGGLASALPMSVQLLAIGISAFVAGRVLDRSYPWRVLAGGFAMQIAGTLLSIAAILFRQYWFLLIAKIIGGFGTGSAVVTCNALPSRANEPQEQQGLIAGLNVGVITGVVLGSSIGGYIAEYLGYPAAYIGSTVCVLIASVLAWRNLRGLGRGTVVSDVPEADDRAGSTLGFIVRPKVFGFLLCIMLPYMLMMYFKDYLFPLFASGLGKTESSIGSVMLLGGAVAIFMGDVLPDGLFRHYGAWNTVRLSSLLSMYALLLFALDPNYITAIVTVVLLGASAAFGYAGQGVYYADLVRQGNIGDGKAMGLFSLFDNLGQTSGPLGLSALMFLGIGAESGVIAIGSAALMLLATVLTHMEGRIRRNGR